VDALSPPAVPQARLQLLYQQRDITHDLMPHLISLTYLDHLSGKPDELEVELEDAAGQWLGAWYPGLGDSLALSIGWEGQPLRDLGVFEIDEIGADGPPSTVSIRALAAGIGNAVRTTEYRAYEKTTLAAVAQDIARRQGMELIGRISPIPLDRLTQRHSDLVFLRQLAAQYDYSFKIVGSKLVFHAITNLAGGAAVAQLSLLELSRYSFRDQLRTIPKAVVIKRHNPATKKVDTHSLIAYDLVDGKVVAVPSSASKRTSSADTHKSNRRASSPETAQAQVQAKNAQADRERTQADLSLMGRPNLVSGNLFELLGAGQLGGTYLIDQARHRFTRYAGYQLDLQASRVRSSAGLAPAKPDASQQTYGIKE
jgi:phage protein D